MDQPQSSGESKSSSRSLGPLVLASLATFILYLEIAWFVLPAEALWSPDEGAKLLQLQSLRIENGQFHYDIPYKGRALDPEIRYFQPDPTRGLIIENEGKLYHQRIFTFPLLSLLPWRLFGTNGLYLLPALSGALTALCALALIRPSDRRPAMWVLIAFASPVLIYSVLFWEHTPATCLCLLATWLAVRGVAGNRSKREWIASGLLLGAAAYLRLETIFYALALILACALCAWRGARGLAGPAVLGITLALIMVPYFPLFNLLFHSPVPANSNYTYRPFIYLQRSGWRAIPDFLLGPVRDEGMDSGPLGTAFSLLVVAAVGLGFLSARRTRSSLWLWAYRLSLGGIAVLSGLWLFAPERYRSTHGFLLSTPWALLGVCRAREVWGQGDQRARLLTLTALLGLCTYAVGLLVLRAADPHGGLEWGARFGLTLYPLLAIIAAWPLSPEHRRAGTYAVLAAFLCLGLGFQLRGLGVIRDDKSLSVAWNREIASVPEAVIVSDLWWLPFNSAVSDHQKPLFLVQGVGGLMEWAAALAQEGIDSFCLVTFDRGLVQALRSLASQSSSGISRLLRLDSIGNLFFMGVEIRPLTGS